MTERQNNTTTVPAFTLQLQTNSRRLVNHDPAPGIMITPPVDEDFWLYRVPVSDEQAIVGFPKFGVIGIGFQHEEDWNTNLPSGSDAEAIYKHIAHNKGDASIPAARCIAAIQLIKSACIENERREAIALLKIAQTNEQRLDILSVFLRHTGNFEVAQTFDQDPKIRGASRNLKATA
ncbi:MAG TPA: hypothetical protein VMQ76_11795 [Terracidiphilus sp.]|nr:hypothetical protein [Terracidiphilus sp.]